MDIKDQQAAQITCLQKNLSAIRKIAGWTSEQLGEKIGVTKQTISNLENGKTQMTLTQYIALRSIIDFEIQTNKGNLVLPQVVEVLLNNYDEYTEEEREKVTENVKTIAATASGGITGAALAAVSAGLLAGILNSPVATATTAAWLAKILKSKGK
ncbi:helix-turn-helix transcriptional regulator [Trichococcus shcherbakoviae]|uniref:HTH cro/C1-type domain-containing protein n=1 Tax=Trichococcus shcherbakoviae TaxID=2094020 RepID=A0A383TJP9_9LACT|nr:helix-turn-helix transcriptional regulator [Trichococcus shcherbakoviae]SYZ79894.1 Hypothetical protein TART1_2770 [Trichococcus shcherbakoviae]